MPGRQYSSGSEYRYGFSGKEKDNEVSGIGNQYDYGFRIYNPRLGKFLSVDPLMKAYPMLTPYQFASNTPIQAIDLDGLEAIQVVNHRTKTVTILTNIIGFDKDDYNTSNGVPKEGTSEQTMNIIQEAVNKYYNTDEVSNYKTESGYGVNFSIGVRKVSLASEANKMTNDNPDRTTRIYPDEVEETRTSTGVSYTMGGTSDHILTVPDNSTKTAAHEIFHTIIHFSGNSNDWKNQIIDLPKKTWLDQTDYHNCFGGILSYADHTLPLKNFNIDQALFATKKIEIPMYGPYTEEQTKILDNIEQNKVQYETTE